MSSPVTKSEVTREILAAGLGGEEGRLGFAEEARRQSLLVSDRCSEQEALDFIAEAADTRGWWVSRRKPHPLAPSP